MGYTIVNHLHEGWIRFAKVYSTDKTLDSYIMEFGIDINDYWILKGTNNFRFIEVKDIGKYANVLLYRKDIFKREDMDRWLEFVKLTWLGFLSNPFPPVYVLDKIKIVEWDMN